MNARVFVMGPTATGKSALAMHLAEVLRAEIINCDSVQLYSKVDIGSAKPSADDLERVPHHLYSVVEPPHRATAGDYCRLVEDKWAGIERPLLFCGGTGFYFQAIENGMFETPVVSQQLKSELESDLEERGLAELYAELGQTDPEYASQISENDSYRIMRALEIVRSGQKVTEVRQNFKQSPIVVPHLKLFVDIPQPELREIVSKRTRSMLERGLVEEVQSLMAEGLKQWWPLKSVGYREVIMYLQGEVDFERMHELIVTSTMQLAKRQRTWFRRDKASQHLLWDGKDFDSLKKSAEALTLSELERILPL